MPLVSTETVEYGQLDPAGPVFNEEAHALPGEGRVLSDAEARFYHEHGYVLIPNVYSDDQIEQMREGLMDLIARWAWNDEGWTGPWRKVYMDEETEKLSKLIYLHDLDLYSGAWMQAATNDRLCDALVDLLGPNVEHHHQAMHVKPPQTGMPFPVHQDWPFYPHTDDRHLLALVHLDDTNDENGCFRFLDGSHKLGALRHIVTEPDGTPCSPHLPTDAYKLEDTTPVHAKAGDVIVFNTNTIHGSNINTTNAYRRVVRIGYRTPDNEQTAGIYYQNNWGGVGIARERPNFMVRGQRPRVAGEEPFPTPGVEDDVFGVTQGGGQNARGIESQLDRD
ncbi:MAG: phytanoyl-CoA dioxygenase family protein [Acidimicrobiales bacterium]